jgi:putative transposase
MDSRSINNSIYIQRLEKAWWRWLTPDRTLKRAGRPRFKNKGEFVRLVFLESITQKQLVF